MIKREFQAEELEAARQLQKECIGLNLMPPPVLSWKYEIKDKLGNVVETGTGKANSYTRNAYNCMAFEVGGIEYTIVSTLFQDGYICGKSLTGSLRSLSASFSPYSLASPSYHYISLGSGEATESLDSYAFTGEVSTGWTIGTTNRVSAFNTTARKLVTQISRTFQNNTGASVDITESGFVQRRYYTTSSTDNFLMIYDVFDAITVADGETITWTYVTEIAYPNP